MPARSASPVAATAANLAEAARLLLAGALVAFPTETVYGLGADATNAAAVAAIFAAKGRPHFNPLIAHVADTEAAARQGVLTPLAERLAQRFWPGPLTLVLARRPDCQVAELASAGLPTVALRVPAHPVARYLLRQVERPVAAPSANPSGRLSPTTAAHVADSLGQNVAMILDGGPCALGLESTVVDCTGEPLLLRPGGVTREAIEAVLGRLGAAGDPARPRAPGQLASHYAPARPLRLAVVAVASDEALLAFGPNPPAGACTSRNLSITGDLKEAAANLFAMLRALDAPPARAIAVMALPEAGLGLAINDRLRRAARPPEPIPC